MHYQLYKPHVAGPDGDITTPDLLLDRVQLVGPEDTRPLPVHRWHGGTAFQAFDGNLNVQAALAVIAAGGGPVLSPAIIVSPEGSALAGVDLVVARSAWRLRTVADHFVALGITIGSNDVAAAGDAAELPALDRCLTRADGEWVLSRGMACVLPHSGAVLELQAPARITLKITDATLGRELTETLDLASLADDRFAQRPLPRYTVGPVGEVKHYI